MSTANCFNLSFSVVCNNVSNSTTSQAISLPNLSQGLMLQFGIFLVTLGNLLVLLTLKTFKRWTYPDVLICSLSTADLLDSFLGLQTLTIMNYYLAAPWERWMCEAYLTFLYTFRLASSSTVTFMAAERAVLVVYPIKHYTMITPLHVKKIVLGVWLFSLLLSVLPLLGFGHTGYRPHSQTCLVQIYSFGFSYTVLIEVYGLLLIAFTLASYIAIKLTTKKFIRRQASLGVKQSYKKQVEKPGREKVSVLKGKRLERTMTGGVSAVKRLNVMMGIVVVVFYISWLPFLLNNLVSVIINKNPNQQVSVFAGLISLLHALVNPVLYGKMSQRYRRGYVHVFKTILMVCGGQRPVNLNGKDSQSVFAPGRGKLAVTRMREAAVNPAFCNAEINPEPLMTSSRADQLTNKTTHDNTVQHEVKHVVDDIINDVVARLEENKHEERARESTLHN